MRKQYLLYLLLILILAFSFSGCKKSYKYEPATKDELLELLDNESINLGEINTGKITDMGRLFAACLQVHFHLMKISAHGILQKLQI